MNSPAKPLNLANEEGQFAGVQPDTSDGVFFSDRDSGVSCAKCDGELTIAEVEHFKIAACRDCHGMLIESRLLARIIGLARANYDGPDAAATPLNPGELRESTECVVCLNIMDTHAYCGPGSVVMDSCHHCGLVWLDGRELQRIIESPGRRDLLAADLMDFDRENPTDGIRRPEDGNVVDDHVAAAIMWLMT